MLISALALHTKLNVWSQQHFRKIDLWASYQIRKISGCACAVNAGNVFPRHRFQRKPLVIDPDMHHGTCVKHVPWCMSGSITNDGGENVPGIPGACATRNFAYLVRGPCLCLWNRKSISGSWKQHIAWFIDLSLTNLRHIAHMHFLWSTAQILANQILLLKHVWCAV